MSLTSTIQRLRERALSILEKLDWLPPLVARICLGTVFALNSGLGKLRHMQPWVNEKGEAQLGTIAQFAEWGVPMPEVNAWVASLSELGCGVLLTVGLFTRFAAGPLIVTMIVAFLTALAPDIHGIRDILTANEFAYIVILLWLVVRGPGPISLDRLLFGPSAAERQRRQSTAAAHAGA